MAGLNITVAEGLAPLGRSRRELAWLAEDILELAGFGGSNCTVRVVGDTKLAELMATHKGVAAPTNTLAFPAEPTGLAEDATLGEVFLSAHALSREAFLYGQNEDEHLVRLLAHALLHLCGYDHGEVMEALTEAAVEELGEREFFK